MMQEEEAAAAASKGGSEVSPNQTIYINNLNEKVKLDGIIICSSFYIDILIFLLDR